MFGSLEHLRKFQRVSRLPSLLQRRRSPDSNQTLHDVWPLLGWYIIYTFSGALAPDRILPGAKFTLRRSFALAYIGSVTARHCSSERLPKFAASYRKWNYGPSQRAPPIYGRAAITLGIDPHSSSTSLAQNSAPILHPYHNLNPNPQPLTLTYGLDL